MLETKLSVPFYGHVRQYHNIQAEIDAKMGGPGKRPVWYRPMLTPPLRHRHRERYRRTLSGVSGLGIGLGNQCLPTTNTFFATTEAIWPTGCCGGRGEADAGV